MDELEMINLLNTLFFVSMALAFVGLCMSVFLFFYLDIRTVRLLMSGKGRVKSVRRVEERHAKTEGLRKDRNLDRSEDTGNRNDGKTEAVAHQQNEPVTGVLQMAVPETSVLNQESAETTFLSRNDPAIAEHAPVNIRFDLTEMTVVIHSDEII